MTRGEVSRSPAECRHAVGSTTSVGPGQHAGPRAKRDVRISPGADRVDRDARLAADFAVSETSGLEGEDRSDIGERTHLRHASEHTFVAGRTPERRGSQDSNLGPPVLETGASTN